MPAKNGLVVSGVEFTTKKSPGKVEDCSGSRSVLRDLGISGVGIGASKSLNPESWGWGFGFGPCSLGEKGFRLKEWGLPARSLNLRGLWLKAARLTEGFILNKHHDASMVSEG